jgi:hypothetical protein
VKRALGNSQETRFESIFLASGQKFARSAVNAYISEDWVIFGLHAGVALELLAKAYLSSLHPSLIVEGVDSLLYACQVPGHVLAPLRAFRTISASEAMSRCGRILPTLTNLTRGELSLIIDVRNGVAHLGQVDQTLASRALAPFVTACDELLGAMSEEAAEFWAEGHAFLEKHLASYRRQAVERVNARLKQARKVFGDRFKNLDDKAKTTLIVSIVQAYEHSGYGRQLFDCPVCGNLALETGTYDFEWTVPEGADSDDPEVWEHEAYPEVTFYPAGLRCQVCGLALNGPDEMEAAGLPPDWIIPQEDVRPEDFIPDYEDEDIY